MSERHRIFHMASFSRSGETLMLRCLNAHPDIHVVHQIREPDTKEDFAFFRFLQTYSETTISRENEHIRSVQVPSENIILLKNAVWEHLYPFYGFILVRNPFSVLRSFGIINEPEEGFLKRKEQFQRWSTGIDPILVPGVVESDNISAFCMVYNRKMFPLKELPLPIVHYERFVVNPEHYFRKILKHFGLQWHDRCLRSHEDYQEGEYGHGHIKLWQPIHAGSVESHKRVPDDIFSRVYGLTWPTLDAYGYQVDGKDVTIRPDFDDRFED